MIFSMWWNKAASLLGYFCGCLTVSADCCVCICFCCQMGREEDCVWTNPVLEPHHAHHAVGEAYQVNTLCSPQKHKLRPHASNTRKSMGHLISDLWFTQIGENPGEMQRASQEKKEKKRCQTDYSWQWFLIMKEEPVRIRGADEWS